jgi:hypothetical protein
VLNSSEAFVLNDVKVPNGTAPADHTSALYPAHFRAVTEPGCGDVNKDYYDCVQNAYRNSKAQGCLAKPEACRWGKYKWLE